MKRGNATARAGMLVMWCGAAAGHAGAQVVGDPIAGSWTPPQFLSECITADARQAIEARIAANRARFGPPAPQRGAPLYPFFPHAGTLYRDLTGGNFVDLNPAPGAVQNYLCDTFGNDGHLGVDTGSPSWEEMAIGLPVFAAFDGVVIDRDDGHPDMNTSCLGTGNYVVLDHGGGRETWYFHLKSGSVSVNVNDAVAAGRQLGLTASSGCSFAPHLHFESRQNGVPYEPFAGPCRPGDSGWVSQIDPPAAAFLSDFGVTSSDIASAPAWPFRPPTSAQIAQADPLIYFWVKLGQLPANSTWKERYVRPNGTVSLELGPFPFGNPGVFGWSLYWFQRDIFEMHTIPGTWRIQFEINGVQLIDAPVEVVPSITPGFNRAPEMAGAAFDPPAPGPDDAVFVRRTWTPGIQDLDWDLVSYRYVWRVEGAVVRDVVSVGGADAVPRNTAAAGQILECTITPSDGEVDGPATTVRVAVGCYGNCDASSVSPRLNVADFTCFLQRFAAGETYANCDDSTTPPVLNVADFTCFLQRFAAGCP